MSGTVSGSGWSIEAWAITCSAQPPPRLVVKPRVRPLLTRRLSRLRHEDVQPRAQLAQSGEIPRGRHGMQGSTDTRVPGATGHPDPASMTRPAISWPRTNGKEPSETRVGDGP